MMRKINSLYLHYPYCKHLCHYCDFYKLAFSNESTESFLGRLLKQFKTNRDFLSTQGAEMGNLDTLYFGGGTPSLMADSTGKLIDLLFNYYQISFQEDYEFTMEVDPKAYNGVDALKHAIASGVNRISIGIQSLDKKIHESLERSHEIKDALELVDWASSNNVNYSVDFIIGVLDNSVHKRSIESELREILKFKPNHISLYILSVGKTYKHFEIMPEDEQVAREFKLVHEILSAEGFIHYEVSNYAKPGFESKHNWKYWEQSEYAALGESATGLIYNNEGGTRYQWKPSGGLNLEELTTDQLNLEKIYTSSRTRKGVSTSLIDLEKKKTILNEYGFIRDDHWIVGSEYWIVLDEVIRKII